jgi:hypothetical protein
MNSRAACIGLILLATVFGGCLPEAKVTWSPDGKFALVRGGDGLRLCDETGKPLQDRHPHGEHPQICQRHHAALIPELLHTTIGFMQENSCHPYIQSA